MAVDRLKRILLNGVAGGAVSVMLAMGAAAQSTAPANGVEDEILLQADELEHDRENDTVTARGSVEFVYGPHILRASAVRYNRATGDVFADGNVVLLQENGDVMFADSMRLDEKLGEGFIRQVRIILADDSRMVAASGRRIADRINRLNKVVYSPCKPCQEDPDREMLWQLKAERVIHDEQDKTIEYEHAWLEVLGFPVAYIPYFSHPDPSVTRKSGFLSPSYGNSSVYGYYVQTPYYHAFSDQQDMTFTPFVTQNDGLIGIAEYRHLLDDGHLNLNGSLSYTDRDTDADNKIRGHIDAEGVFDINRLWRWGFDAEHASDDSYLRRYGFDGRSILESRLFLEGFDDQDYALVETKAWQAQLDTDDPGETPFIWPMMEYEHYTDHDAWGGRTRIAGHFLNLTRDEGSDNSRVIAEAEYALPFHTAWGDQIEFNAGTQARFYQVDTNNLAQDDGAKDGFHANIWPWMEATWSRPYAAAAGSALQYLEPIVQLHVSPYGSTGGAPNNDSRSLTIDQTNLFETNRFTGLDRLSGGPRATWGGRYSIVGASGGHSNFFLGQSYRLKEDATYPAASGFERRLSDVIASWEIAPSGNFNMTTSLSLASENLALRRAETQVSFGPSFLRTSLSHAKVRADASQTEFSDEEQLNASATVIWIDDLTSKASFLYDIQDDRALRWSLDTTYILDDCVVIGINASETFTQSQGVPSSFNIGFTINLINLG